MSSQSTTCSRCGGATDIDTSRYCRSCRAAYMRDWRAAGRERLTAEDVRRHAIRVSSRMKLRRWGLRLTQCQLCGGGTGRIECHHPSYETPWASWVFNALHPDCHRLLHHRDLTLPDPIDLRDINPKDPTTYPEWLAPR